MSSACLFAGMHGWFLTLKTNTVIVWRVGDSVDLQVLLLYKEVLFFFFFFLPLFAIGHSAFSHPKESTLPYATERTSPRKKSA